jgi:hypothetical protein
MSQPPTPFARSWSFTDFSTNNPTTPHQGQKIDLELNNVLAVLNYTISRLNEVQADDGKVRNSGLNFTTIAAAIGPILSVSIINSINSAGTTQVTAVNTAGSTQVAAVNAAGATFAATASAVSVNAAAAASSATTAEGWKNSAQASALSATNSANTAFVHKNTALSHANDAFTHSDNAASSAAAASFSLSGCISSAGQASYEASQANAYSVQAETSKVGALDAQAQAQSASSSASSSAISATASAVSATASASSAASSASSAYNYYSAFNLSVGTVSTGVAGSQAVVTRTGTAPSYLLNFTIPAGAAGAAGVAGTNGTNGTNGVGVPVGGSTAQALVKASGANYDTTWSTIVSGDRYLTTSVTSNTVSNGNKTFTIGTGLSYTPTQNITISFNAANHMHGEVLTYNSGTGVLTVNINNNTGSGTYTSWVVNVGGVTPVTSVAWGAITGTLSSQTDLNTALSGKAPLASPTFTGDARCVTPATSDNDTSIATTAFVKNQAYLTASLAASTYYLQSNPSGFISDAPSNSIQYARYNGTWAAVSGGGGGISDAPSDGKAYSRKDAGWVTDRINAYDNTVTYTLGDQVVYSNVIYQMTTVIGAAGYDPIGNPSYWTGISGPAGAAGANGANGAAGANNYLDIITMTSSSASLYVSGNYWYAGYGFMNTGGGWFYNKLNASGVTFKFYINGVFDSSVVGAYNYYSASTSYVTTPVTNDVMTVFISDGTSDATIPLVTAIY